MPVLQTARLTLERFTTDDAEFVLALLNEPSFLQFIGDRGVRTLDDARRYIVDGPVASYERFGFGLYAVRRTSGVAPIGMCGLLRRETLDAPDIGFAFSPAYWGNGYARESAAAVLDHARRDLGITRLLAIVSPENRASIAVLEALGMRFQDMQRLAPGGTDVHVYSCDLTPPDAG